MRTFRSIDELVRTLDRERELLREMFHKRTSLSFKYDFAVELTDYKEERVQSLINHGVIRSSGDFLEMEDIYLKFFEEVPQVNEEVNVAYIQGHLSKLNEQIEYYLKENNERRRYNYHNDVRRTLKNIALTTVRNVIDLKRNLDSTYKNEPNYQIKKVKLQRLGEKLKNIIQLINKCENAIDKDQLLFFRKAMDAQMRATVSDVKLQLIDSSHNLMEIQRQIVHYLNMIEYQNRIFEKVRKLKYLKEQFLLEENTNIKQVLAERNHVWMEPQPSYRIKLSIDYLRNSDEALTLIKKLATKLKRRDDKSRDVAEAIPTEYLEGKAEVIDQVNLREVYNSFVASGEHLFAFVMNYAYKNAVSTEDKLVFFCQIASEYAEDLNFSDRYECKGQVEYPLVFPK